jgi:hypothetical protein
MRVSSALSAHIEIGDEIAFPIPLGDEIGGEVYITKDALSSGHSHDLYQAPIGYAIGTTPANAWASWDASSTEPTRGRGSKRCDSILGRRLSSIPPLPRPMLHLAVRQSAIGEISPESRVATQMLRGIPQHNYFLVSRVSGIPAMLVSSKLFQYRCGSPLSMRMRIRLPCPYTG